MKSIEDMEELYAKKQEIQRIIKRSEAIEADMRDVGIKLKWEFLPKKRLLLCMQLLKLCYDLENNTAQLDPIESWLRDHSANTSEGEEEVDD